MSKEVGEEVFLLETGVDPKTGERLPHTAVYVEQMRLLKDARAGLNSRSSQLARILEAYLTHTDVDETEIGHRLLKKEGLMHESTATTADLLYKTTSPSAGVPSPTDVDIEFNIVPKFLSPTATEIGANWGGYARGAARAGARSLVPLANEFDEFLSTYYGDPTKLASWLTAATATRAAASQTIVRVLPAAQATGASLSGAVAGWVANVAGRFTSFVLPVPTRVFSMPGPGPT
jgi:hypothetical protein